MANYFDRFDPKPSKRGKSRGAMEEVFGGAMHAYSEIPFMDEGSAAMGAAYDLATGKAGSIGQAWEQNREKQRRSKEDFQERRPVATNALKTAGMGASLAIPGGAQAKAYAEGTRATNFLRGATQAGATAYLYGLADDGSAGERFQQAAEDASNPVVLGLGGTLGQFAPRATPKAKPTGPRTTSHTEPKFRDAPPAAPAPRKAGQVLADVGVSTTVPQRAGRAAKGLEDIFRRFPITGQAMAGYQERQLGQLNRAVGLKALQPVGLGIPKEVKPGFEMVEYVDGKLGDVYDKAAALAPTVRVDEKLLADAERIGARRADLAESEARQFDSIMKDRLTRLSSGEASGAMVKQIHGELGALQAEASRKGQATLSAMLGDVRRSVMGLVERANPEARRLIQRADQGWEIYSVMNDAAAAASAKGGVFLPGQLNTQVRASAKRLGSNMAGKGKGTLQDVATAASETIPDSYGNPGTANAALGAAGLWGLITDPIKTIGAGAGLAAAATPYLLAGRKVLEALPEGATLTELKAAERELARLASRDPSVEALRRELVSRLSMVEGATARDVRPPQNALTGR